jgi:hypothetical protein
MGQQSGRANPICSGAICALQGGAARGGLRARFECACQANRRAESDSYSETRRLRPRCAQRRGYGNHSGRQRACMMRTPCPSPRLFLALQSGKSWPMQEHIVVAALVLRHTEGSDRDWSPRPHAAATGDYVLEKSENPTGKSGVVAATVVLNEGCSRRRPRAIRQRRQAVCNQAAAGVQRQFVICAGAYLGRFPT